MACFFETQYTLNNAKPSITTAEIFLACISDGM